MFRCRGEMVTVSVMRMRFDWGFPGDRAKEELGLRLRMDLGGDRKAMRAGADGDAGFGVDGWVERPGTPCAVDCMCCCPLRLEVLVAFTLHLLAT